MRIKYKLKDIGNDPLRSLDQVLLTNWISNRITWILANFTKISPNLVTSIGFLSVIIAAFMLFTNHLILAAIFYYVRWVADNVDGKLARLIGAGSKFGAFWDNYTGIVGDAFCVLALAYSQANIAGNFAWLLVAFTVWFFRTLYFFQSMKVTLILGTQSGEKVSKGNSIISKLYRFLAKRELREPFNPADERMLLFVVFPIVSIYTGFLLEMWLFIVIIMTLKAFFWLYYYSRILIRHDRQN